MHNCIQQLQETNEQCERSLLILLTQAKYFRLVGLCCKPQPLVIIIKNGSFTCRPQVKQSLPRSNGLIQSLAAEVCDDFDVRASKEHNDMLRIHSAGLSMCEAQGNG